MAEKKWKNVYRDTIKISDDIDPVGNPTKRYTAENHPGGNAPISYDKKENVCFIHTDEVINGLTLVDQNAQLKPNIKKISAEV